MLTTKWKEEERGGIPKRQFPWLMHDFLMWRELYNLGFNWHKSICIMSLSKWIIIWQENGLVGSMGTMDSEMAQRMSS